MIVTIEVSMYPLSRDYIPVIDKFLSEIRNYKDLSISTNPSSTRIQGEFEETTKAVNSCIKSIYEDFFDKVAVVMKVLNSDIKETKWDDR